MVISRQNIEPVYLVTLLILFMPTVGLAVYATPDQLIRFFPDDAFYYLQTAFNAAHYGRVSFDGISATNGFHPLQFLLSYLSAKMADKNTLLRYAVVENAVLVLLTSMVLVEHFFRDLVRSVRSIALVVLACSVWYLYVWLDAGMEIGLVLFIGVLFYCAWERAESHAFASLKENCWLAAYAALLILARLDLSIPLSLFALVYIAFAMRKKLSGRYIVVPAFVAALLLLPYLAWNLTKFGHLVPISGVVKAAAAHDIGENWRALSSGSMIGVALVLLPALSAFTALWAGAVPRSARLSFGLLLVSIGIYLIYILFFAQQVFRWYLAYPLVLQSVSVALLLRKLLQHERLPAALNSTGAVFCLAVLSAGLHAALYLWASRADTTSFHLKCVAEDLNVRLNQNDIVATYDAGVIGYFSAARVINLDGLANSYEYYESYLRPHRIGAYLKKIRATYYLTRMEPDGARGLPFPHEPALAPVAEYHIPGQFDLGLYRIP